MILKNTNITTIEQTERLYNIGFDESFADENFGDAPVLLAEEDENAVNVSTYAFSLTGLINLLPREIVVEDIHYKLHLGHHNISYCGFDEDERFIIYHSIDIPEVPYNVNPYIEMVINMLDYIKENNLMNSALVNEEIE